MRYKLTEEGKEYLMNGLPEKRLIEVLDSMPQKSAKIAKIALRIKNFLVALKWAIEKGWVIKRGDEVILLSKPDRIPEQEALAKLPMQKTLNFWTNPNFLSFFSSGSTNAPGKKKTSMNPIDLILTPSTLLIIPWKNSCGTTIETTVRTQNQNGINTYPGPT